MGLCGADGRFGLMFVPAWDLYPQTPCRTMGGRSAATGKLLGPPITNVHHRRRGVTIDPVGTTLVTCQWDGNMLAWPTPVALVGDPDHIALRVQVLTGLELQSGGAIRMLDQATWSERRDRLRQRDAE